MRPAEPRPFVFWILCSSFSGSRRRYVNWYDGLLFCDMTNHYMVDLLETMVQPEIGGMVLAVKQQQGR